MKKSFLFRRVFAVVVAALLVMTALTTLTFSIVARAIFTNNKKEELLPKARALGNFVEAYHRGELGEEQIINLFGSYPDSRNLFGGDVLVIDAEGAILTTELTAAGMDWPKLDYSGLDGPISEVLGGNEIAVSGVYSSRELMFGVGTPIIDEGEVLGAVFIFVPFYEVTAASGSLNTALFISLLISVPVVSMMVFGVVGHIIKPLRQMQDVARSMSSGNFSARADDTQRGEIGHLARTLNLLSRELSRNIQELTLERNRLKQSVDGLGEGFISVNSTGRITHTNPALEEMFSTLPHTGADPRMRLIPDAGLWEDFDRAVSENVHAVRDLKINDRIIQASITPILDDGGQNAGAVCLFRDVTESERLEATRRDYVANVSHELRSPLTAMRGLIEPLKDGMVKSEDMRVKYYGIIHRETLRLSRLIDDLLVLSRLQSGALGITMSPTDLSEIFSDIEERYRVTAEEHGLTFSLTVDPATLPVVETNADRAEQIIVILLDNAIKYTPEGGTISMGAEWDDERVIIMVRDTGVGISDEDLPYVFDRFYKVDKAHSSMGSGLGLSIASEILAIMGENITVTSVAGEGSVFSFTLKRRTAG